MSPCPHTVSGSQAFPGLDCQVFSPQSFPLATSHLRVRPRPSSRHSRDPFAGGPRPPSLGLTWASTTLGRKLRVTSSCTAAAAPCPAPARRTPRLMLTSPPTAAGRSPRGQGTAGGPGDDPRGLLPAAERLQGQRSARPYRVGVRSARRPAAASEAGAPSTPTSSPRRPRPRLPLRPGHAPSERGALWELWSRTSVRAPPVGRRGLRPSEPGNYNCRDRSASPGPRTPRWPMRWDHAGLQNKRRCGRVGQ